MRYYYRSVTHANECPDFAGLIARTKRREFTLTRSTVPLLAYWRQPVPRLEDLLQRVVGVAPVEPSKLVAEKSVRTGIHRSAPSQSDLFYEDERVALAIEGKWTEPRYPTVEQWLQKGKNRRHREQVLEKWCAMIRPYTVGGRLDADVVGPLVYQMLHRTASACESGKQNAGVLLQSFRMVGARHTPLHDDVASLVRVLQPTERLRIALQVIDVTATPAYEALRDAAPRMNAAELAEALRALLINGEPFTFVENALQGAADLG